MSDHPTDFHGSVTDAIRDAVLAKLPDARVDVTGGGGHYTLTVVSTVFAGKGMVEAHRIVYAAVAGLMAGPTAPVHAIDKLTTKSA